MRGTNDNFLDKQEKITDMQQNEIFTFSNINENLDYPSGMNHMIVFNFEQGMVLMMSFLDFRLFYLSILCYPYDYLEIGNIQNNQEHLIWRKCLHDGIPTDIYKRPVYLRFISQEAHPSYSRSMTKGFKFQYSVHNANDSVTRIRPGLFNCSHGVYDYFRAHLDCNMKIECVYNEDEREHCSFYNDNCPPGSLYFSVCFSKCLTFSKNIFSLVSVCQKQCIQMKS